MKISIFVLFFAGLWGYPQDILYFHNFMYSKSFYVNLTVCNSTLFMTPVSQHNGTALFQMSRIQSAMSLMSVNKTCYDTKITTIVLRAVHQLYESYKGVKMDVDEQMAMIQRENIVVSKTFSHPFFYRTCAPVIAFSWMVQPVNKMDIMVRLILMDTIRAHGQIKKFLFLMDECDTYVTPQEIKAIHYSNITSIHGIPTISTMKSAMHHNNTGFVEHAMNIVRDELFRWKAL